MAEARFLQFMEEDENRDNGEVFTVKEEVKPVKEPKVDLNRVVEACMRQLQALQARKSKASGLGMHERGEGAGVVDKRGT